MKIPTIGLCPSIKTNLAYSKNKELGSLIAIDSFPIVHSNSLYTSSYPKDFFVANSNISFNGIQCSPDNFKIKTAYGVECPCCGQVMLTKKQSNAFVSRISDKKGVQLQNELQKESSYFRKNEQQIADILIKSSQQNPDMTLSQLVSHEAKDSLASLETEQKNIIETIRQVAKNLSPKKREQLIQILNDEENLIDNSDDYVHFKRKNFLDKVSVFCKNCSDKDQKAADEIFELSQSMPASGTSKDAFFVKYQRRTNEDIARRLVMPAMVTTEHIRPQSKNGKNNTDNYIPLCGDCNSRRGNIPYNDWFKIHPEMPANLQEYIYQISDIIKNKGFAGWQLYDTYVDDVIEAVYLETGGKLKLKPPEETKKEELQNPVETIEDKPKPIEELREIWMSKYEKLIKQIEGLHILRDELYSDEEFLNILEYLKITSQIETSKQNVKRLHRNYLNISSYLKRAKKELNNARKNDDSVDRIVELNNTVQAARTAANLAKGDYILESKNHSFLLQQRDILKQKVTTPEEILAEISKVKQQREAANSDLPLSESSAKQEHSDLQLLSLENSSKALLSQIAQKKAANAKKEKMFDFESPKSKKIATRYYELKTKMSMVDSIDVDTFRKLFSDSISAISPEFILDEARAALHSQMENVLKSPIAQFYKTKDEISELEFKKRVIDSEITKLKTKVDYDAKLDALYKRKAEIQKKFSNVDIDETIAKLQEKADDNLQKFTDSFECFDGYQHSKPKLGS